MRRGLMAWDANEIPVEVLRQRVQRLQSAMTKAGQDALLLYTNFIRSGAVSYLTAFSPYWADGVLLVPRAGEPLFATTLSKRVGSWIQTVKPIGDLVNSPSPGRILGERLAANGARRVAILELDAFPSGLYDDLATALPGAEIVDGTEMFAAARAQLDAVERRLLERAERIGQDALDRLNLGDATNVGVVVGNVEKHARLQGAEEVYVAIAPDLDEGRTFVRLSGNRPLGRRFAMRATVAYKGAWVRRTKSYSRDDADRLSIARADAWFKAFLAGMDARGSLSDQVATGLAGLSRAELVAWTAESPLGTRPLAEVASGKRPNASLHGVPALCVSIGLNIDSVPWCGAGLARLTDGPFA